MNLEKREANIHTRSVSPSLRPPQGGVETRECDGFTTNSPSSSSSSCPDHIKRLSLLPCLEGVAELNFSSSSNAAWRGPRISLLPPPPPFVTALLSRKGTAIQFMQSFRTISLLLYFSSYNTSLLSGNRGGGGEEIPVNFVTFQRRVLLLLLRIHRSFVSN